MNFELKFVANWDVHFCKFDKPTKLRILKTIEKLKTKESSRHLKHGLPFFVEESGQYRIGFIQDDASYVREIYFVGDHKQYKKWYSTL